MPLGDGSSLSAEQGNILVSRTSLLQKLMFLYNSKHLPLYNANLVIFPVQDGFGLHIAAGKRRSICAGATSDEFTVPSSSFSATMQTGTGTPPKALKHTPSMLDNNIWPTHDS